MTHQVKLNNCAGCMRKRSLLPGCPTYILKGKAVPLQAWSGPEGSRKFPDFMTTAQDGGKVSLYILKLQNNEMETFIKLIGTEIQ
jgi:hypothetical protein